MNPHPSTLEAEVLEEEAEEALENYQEIVELFPPVNQEWGLNVTYTVEHTFSGDDDGAEVIIDNDNCLGLYDEVEYDSDDSDDDIIPDTSVEILEGSVYNDDDEVTIVEAATAGPSVKRKAEDVPFVSKLSLSRGKVNKKRSTFSYDCDNYNEGFVLARDLYDQE